MGAGTQQLILIISRNKLNPNLIPPFKIILPTLGLISPLKLYTSMIKQIKPENFANLYEALVHHLQNQEGEVSLNSTLNFIYESKLLEELKAKAQIHNLQTNQQANLQHIWNFRICVLGQEIIDWDIVMKYKLKNIVIDTVGNNKRLLQISFATGGINKPSLTETLIRNFLTIFSLSSEIRHKFNFLSKDEEYSIDFTVDCVCCSPNNKQLSNQCYLCSKCLSVHCSRINQVCSECQASMEIMELKHRPC